MSYDQPDEQRTARIRTLNDALRRDLAGGQVNFTSGIASLGFPSTEAAMNAVREFNAFGPDNDPYGEHDFGSLIVAGEKIFWKIDYYDKAMEGGSPDPADPAVTTRVLTVMLAEEY